MSKILAVIAVIIGVVVIYAGYTGKTWREVLKLTNTAAGNGQ